MRDKENLKKVTAEIQLKEWVNGVLVVACTRLGFNKIQKELVEQIQFIMCSRLSVGILGGRPNEAYYLVGM